MKNKLVLLVLFSSLHAYAQVEGSLEQIYYYDKEGGFTMGPLAQIQTKKNWFAEARYNYEEARSVSFYIGKAYERDGNFSYTIVPLFGGVTGRYKGGSAALNMDMTYKNFYFSSQSQYTFSIEDELDNFYFSWSELGYEPFEWIYGGIAVQETYFPQLDAHVTHPGFVIGFIYRKWTLPFYVFRTGQNSSSLVCSLLYEW